MTTSYFMSPRRCDAWCFIFGLISLPSIGLPSCHLDKGHEGDHNFTVEFKSSPSAKFSINWNLTEEENNE